MQANKWYYLLAIFLFATESSAQADDYFDPSMLEHIEGQDSISSLKQFTKGNFEDNKHYPATLFFNNIEIGDSNFLYKANHAGILSPVITKSDLESWGVKHPVVKAIKPSNFFVTDVFPDATATQDIKDQRVDITIPQSYLDDDVEQNLSLNNLDEGIPGLMSTYTFSGSNTLSKTAENSNSSSQYLNLKNSMNIGAWRLKNLSSWNKSSTGASQWQAIQTYAERDIVPIKGTITAGQLTSDSKLFDSFNFSGIKLATEDTMYSDTMMSFAPVITGIAKSNAKITIKQNNYQIYQKFVPPGPFSISDYNPSSSGGDLDVTITESDGTERHQIQSFASIPLLQREGKLDYEINAGKYRPADSSDEDEKSDNVTQITLFYGLPKDVTLYGGTVVSTSYHAYAAGLGYDMGLLGALSLDETATSDATDALSGKRAELSYSKYFEFLGSTLNASESQYTNGYRTFEDSQRGTEIIDDTDINTNKKSYTTLSLNKSFDDFGSIYISYNNYTYWDSSSNQKKHPNFLQ